MIADGDKVMVCLSGGKDSYALLDILLHLRQHAPIALRARRGQPRPEAARASRRTCCPTTSTRARRAVPHRAAGHLQRGEARHPRGQDDVLAVLAAAPRRALPRRGRARRTKIALGHHRDDILETFLLNLFYSGQLKAMPPKLRSDDGRHVVIRPLVYCEETRPRRVRRACSSFRSSRATCAARRRT